jgi:hypothetical protein
MASVTGTDDGSGYGVKGESPTGSGVVGIGDKWAGVVASSVTGSGVSAFSDSGAGVLSVSNTGAGVSGQSGQATGVAGVSTDGAGVSGESLTGIGVRGMSSGDNGVLGSSSADKFSGVAGRNTAGKDGVGVIGIAEGLEGIGVFGQAASRGVGVIGNGATGVLGQGQAEPGVRGTSEGNHGVVGTGSGDKAAGVVGTGQAGPGVVGTGHGGPGVAGTSEVLEAPGVRGENTQLGTGVLGISAGTDRQIPVAAGVIGKSAGTAPGVIGESANGNGVVGAGAGLPSFLAPNTGAGVLGISKSGAAVEAWSFSDGTLPAVEAFGGKIVALGGVGAIGSLAGSFIGEVFILGDLKVIGGKKQFVIDHPLDPERRYLQHAAVESAELKTFYDGTATLNNAGTAMVELPGWFGALNGELCYSLTAIGGPAPDLHIAAEFDGTGFTIAGGRPGGRVCWQITGIRQDPSARAHPLVVEEDKPAQDIGRFADPAAADRSQADGLQWAAELHARQAEAEQLLDTLRRETRE